MHEGQKKPRNTGTETPLAIERRAAGLTQQQLADLLGVPLRTIQHWESGTRTPSEYVLQLVLEKLRTPGHEHLVSELLQALDWDKEHQPEEAVRTYAATMAERIREYLGK